MYVSAADSRTAALVFVPALLGVAIGLACWRVLLLRRGGASPANYTLLLLNVAPICVLAWFMFEGAFDWRVWSSIVVGALIPLAIVALAARKARAQTAPLALPSLTPSYVSTFSTISVYLLLVLPFYRQRSRELAHGIVVTHGVISAHAADSLERLHPSPVPKGARSVRTMRAAVRTSFVRDDWNGPYTVCDEQPLHINVDLLNWPDSPSDSAFEGRAVKAARAFLASHRRSSFAKPTMTIEQCAAELRKVFTRELGSPQRVATSAWLSSPDTALNTPTASPHSPR